MKIKEMLENHLKGFSTIRIRKEDNEILRKIKKNLGLRVDVIIHYLLEDYINREEKEE